jgi:hypothetical protein
MVSCSATEWCLRKLIKNKGMEPCLDFVSFPLYAGGNLININKHIHAAFPSVVDVVIITASHN